MTAFAKITAKHDLILADLPPAAGLLYRWLLRAMPAGKVQEIELDTFRDFSQYSLKWIKITLTQLVDQGLVEVVKRYNSKTFKLIAFHPEEKNIPNENPPPEEKNSQDENFSPEEEKFPDGNKIYREKKSQDWNKTSSFGNKTSSFGNKTSKKGPSNPDSSVHNNRENIERTNTPTHHPVLKNEKEEILRQVAEAIAHPQIAGLIVQNSIETVMQALEVVKQTQNKKNPAGLLVRAIQQKWKPQRKTQERSEQSFEQKSEQKQEFLMRPDSRPWQNSAENFQQKSQQEFQRMPENWPQRAFQKKPQDKQTPRYKMLGDVPLPDGFKEWFEVAIFAGVANDYDLLNGELLVRSQFQVWETWPVISNTFSFSRVKDLAENKKYLLGLTKKKRS
jgi:hypothetical protein